MLNFSGKIVFPGCVQINVNRMTLLGKNLKTRYTVAVQKCIQRKKRIFNAKFPE